MRVFCLIIFLLLNLGLYSQNRVDISQDSLISVIKDINKFDDASMIDDNLVEVYNNLINNKIELNKQFKKLLEYNIISKYQYSCLSDYIKKNGKILSFKELMNIDGFSPSYVKKILPFLKIDGLEKVGSDNSKIENRNIIGTKKYILNYLNFSYKEKYSIKIVGAKNNNSYNLKSANLYCKIGKYELILGDYICQIADDLGLSNKFITSYKPYIYNFGIRQYMGGSNNCNTGFAAQYSSNNMIVSLGSSINNLLFNNKLKLNNFIATSLFFNKFESSNLLSYLFDKQGNSYVKLASSNYLFLNHVDINLGLGYKQFLKLNNKVLDTKLGLRLRFGDYDLYASSLIKFNKNGAKNFNISLAFSKYNNWVYFNIYDYLSNNKRLKFVANCEYNIKYFTFNLKLRELYDRGLLSDISFNIKYDNYFYFAFTSRFNYLNNFSYLFVGELGYKSRLGSVFLSVMPYNISNYKQRMYVYKRGLYQQFNCPAYFGRGLLINSSMFFKYRFKRLNMRIGLCCSYKKENPKPIFEFRIQSIMSIFYK